MTLRTTGVPPARCTIERETQSRFCSKVLNMFLLMFLFAQERNAHQDSAECNDPATPRREGCSCHESDVRLRVHAERAGSAAHRGAELSFRSGFRRRFASAIVELFDKLRGCHVDCTGGLTALNGCLSLTQPSVAAFITSSTREVRKQQFWLLTFDTHERSSLPSFHKSNLALNDFSQEPRGLQHR